MTAATTKKEYSTFVKGIITEAGPLTYPENSSLDEENCVLNRDGSRQRRLGMNFEDDFVLRSVTVLVDDAVGSYRWYNAANSFKNQLAVVQVGNKLLVFNANAPSISAALLATVDASAYITGKTPIQVASGLGFLFVGEGTKRPFYLSYNPTTFAVTLSPITIKVRDFFGLDSGIGVEFNPGTLSTNHDYNLRNQGWSAARITAYQVSQSVFPANNQQWFLGRKADNTFDPVQLRAQDFGSTPAPKGRAVIDAFARSTSRDTFSGLTTPVDLELGYPSTVAFAYERVFYAGCASTVIAPTTTQPNYNGFIFFSRTLRSAADAEQCYSDADPTSEVDSDLVDTDGGYVNIPDSGKIHKLLYKGGQVLIFADNGVWAIVGDEGGFRATSYQVIKLTDFGVLSSTSIVDTEDTAFYWNRGGIYYMAADEGSGRLTSKNISENSIQTLYNNINQVAKTTAVGSYDPINRKLSWMYNNEVDYSATSYRNRYTNELCLDLVLGAFYKNSISAHSTPSPYIAGYLPTPDFLLRQEGVRTRGESITKYLVVQFINPLTNAASVTFSYYRDTGFKDWRSIDALGISYKSFLITGYEIMGDTIRHKQAPYLFMHFKQTEKFGINNGAGVATADNPSGLIVQQRWDWSDSHNSGKWGEPFQAYRLLRPYVMQIGEAVDYGSEVVSTKNRITGRGRALSIYMESDANKDFYLYGWAVKFSGNTNA